MNKALYLKSLCESITNSNKYDKKYKPKNKGELRDLIEDPSIHLGEIDTSLITEMSMLFYRLKYPRYNVLGIETWDVSNVTDMEYLFAGLESDSINVDLSQWDVSKVKNMRMLFAYGYNCKGIENWNVSNVTNMSEMFASCERMDLDLSKWNVSKVTNMSEMFSGCKNFTGKGLDKWDVSNVTDMKEMFKDCIRFNQNLDNWKLHPNVQLIRTFQNCNIKPRWIRELNNKLKSGSKYRPTNLSELEDLVSDNNIYLGDIDTSKITNMSRLFYNNKRDNFDGIETWDVSNVTDMSYMFRDCTKFNQPIGNWNVSKVTNMSWMFADCFYFNQPLNNWDVSNVTDMAVMFSDCGYFDQPLDKWDVSKVTNMNSMFRKCWRFTGKGLDKWDVSNVKHLHSIFMDAKKLNQLPNGWESKLKPDVNTDRAFTM